MVATRRMVQQDPTEDELAASDPDVMLKKKPVRKATAKAAEKTATIGKGRGTRGKKAQDVFTEAEPAEEMDDAPPVKATKKTAGRPKKEAAVVEAEPEPAKTTRGAKAGSVRGKKAIAPVEEEPVEERAEELKPTRATKAGSVRGRKAAAPTEDEATEPAAEAPKPSKTSKGGSVRGKKAAPAVEDAPALPAPEPKPTRGTRATASKPQPLSPKKITQVSKPPIRNTRSATEKPASKGAAAQPPTKGRAMTKKRTVSDENAEVADLHQALDDNEEVVMLSSTPVKKKPTRAQVKKQQEKAESEASMSSAPTTPNDSTMQSLDKDESQQDEEMDDVDPISEDELAANEPGAEQDASLDELCGPKTPMKRGSPGAEARYLSSVQRTIRKYEDTTQGRVQTPAIRYAVLGSQRGTPQTQKPYCKPVPPPSSQTRPMTVARAAGREFVFRDLADGAPALPENEVDEDASFVVDDDIIPVDTHHEVVDAAADVAATPTPAVAPLQLHSPPSSVSEADEADEAEDLIMLHTMDDEENFIAPAEIEHDPEETMLADDADIDMEEASVTSVQPAESFETEDTVIITRPTRKIEDDATLDSTFDDQDSDNESVIVHDIGSPAATTEAIDWQPKKDEATITVNFDELFTGARSAADDSMAEPTFDEAATEIAQVAKEDDAVVGAEMDFQPESVSLEQPSRRQTMNLNDFIDVGALSEPTEALNLTAFTEPAIDHETVVQQSTFNAETVEAGILIDNEDQDMVDENEHHEDLEQQRIHEPNQAPSVETEHMPHYALSTVAYDARRKSLPVLMHRTPTKTAPRPHTSDGASMPRIANPFANAWWSKSRALSSTATPVKARPSTVHSLSAFEPTIQWPAKTPVATPKERFPRLAPRQDYVEHARTVAAPRFKDPIETSTKRRETFHKGASGRVSASTPKAAESPATPKAVYNAPSTPKEVETPTTSRGERYPRLRHRADYSEHAKTVAAPVRFHTPVKTPLKRPATAQKPDSLRKAALKANTPMASRSPTKTPLKAAAMTPGQEPLTPHPAAPLRGIVALVEVYTLEGASASSPFIALLHRLGAKTTKAWGDRVTHVVFKDGSPTTLQRVRLHNKDVEEKGSGSLIHCVNSRWVTDCDTEGARVDESDEAYVVDVAEIPRGGKRRRKSMEPSALLNIGGNIVRDRKSSAGRTPSFGRSPLKFAVESPAKKTDEVPEGTPAGKENSGDEASSPATPAWIADPGHLVQQTAPMNRVRKLDLPGKEAAKSRRLTFWDGGA